MALQQDSRKSSGQKLMESLTLNEPIFDGSSEFHQSICGYADDKGKWVNGLKFTLYVEGAFVKAAINDPGANTVAFATLDSSKPLGAALAEVCDAGGLEWRKSRGKS